MRSWWCLAAFALLSGCSSPDAAPATGAQVDAGPADPWEGTTEQVILDVAGGGFQFDALCAFGGGVEMERADGSVLAGSKSVEATVEAPDTTTGLQLGYVITNEPEYDETQQAGITWFEPVRGGSQTFSVPVTPDAYEDPEGDNGTLWHFFLRMNVPAAEQDCYTGGMAGDFALRAVAVKG